MENEFAELSHHELVSLLVGDDTRTESVTPTGKEIITIDQLADLLGITANRVGVLTREGHIPRVSRGRYQRRLAVRGYCEHLRKQASGRGAANPEYTEQKTRLAREQADKAEMQNAIARRELIPALQVEREWSAILRDVRAAMLAIPSRFQQRVGAITAHDASILSREIRNALVEIASIDP